MAAVSNLLVNIWRFGRNARARLLGRPPGFVWIEISGSLPEFETPTGLLRRRLARGPGPPTLEALRGRLDAISADGRPRGVVLRIKDLDAGWAALEEARREILAFRGRGGRVVAFLSNPADTRSYYLACAADEVLAAPLVTLGVTGVSARVNFFKDALEKLGLGAEVVAVSPFKAAGDPYVRNDFSEQAREQTERLLDGRYGEVVRALSEGRGFTAEEARAKIDAAPYDAKEAFREGLIDDVCYEDELPERLGSGGERVRLAEWPAARRSLTVPYRRRPRRVVGVVGVKGAIVRGAGRRLPIPLPFLGGEQAGSDAVVAALRVAERSRRVGAVLLHVDSPGGDALASDQIWREVQRINGKKPVVVLMGNVAASGGYYISAPAAHVVARSSTVTGSIGVLSIRPVAEGLYDKLGVNPVSVRRGERAGLLDVAKRPTDDELRVIERSIGRVYDEFKDRVSRGRNLAVPEVEDIAGGQVWSGAEALERGLVDAVGGFRDAFTKARELGGIDREGPDALVKIPTPRGGRPGPGDPASAIQEALAETRKAVAGLGAGGVWAMGPYEIREG